MILFLRFPFYCFLFIFSFCSLWGVDYDDLEETRVKVYGSEKDKKYRLDGFFVEWENWPRENPTHNHFHFLWFANTTNYPKFKKNQIFPFFSTIESKVDPRSSKNYLLLYSSEIDRDGNESNFFLPFYFSGKGKDNSSYLGIFPFFYSSRMESPSYSNSNLIFPGYYYDRSYIEKTNTIQSLSISPFHYNATLSRNKQESKTSWFPLIPIVYKSEEQEDRHTNYFWIFDTNRNLATDQLDRVWILPFFYWKQNSYLSIFPIYLNKLSDKDNTGEWYALFPPLYNSYSPNHSVFYFLNYYTSKKNLSSTKDEFTTFFPFYLFGRNASGETSHLIPFIFSYKKEADKTSETNFLLLFDLAFDKNEKLERFWFLPFYFYKKNEYNYVFPFFFQNSRKEEGFKEKEISSSSWFGFLPPIYISISSHHSTFYLINFYRNTTVHADKVENTTAFVPIFWNYQSSQNESSTIVPFVYYKNQEKNQGIHTNFLTLLDYTVNQEDELTRVWLFPFYFYKKNSYHYILPFYFANQVANKDKEENTWGPFYYFHETSRSREKLLFLYYHSAEKTKYADESVLNVFPFFYSWKKEKNESVYSIKLEESGFLFFPFFYRTDHQGDGTFSNFLGFVSWSKNKEEQLTQMTVFPFRFYKKNQYSIWFPFSFQFGNTENNTVTGKRWGLGFYSSWSPEKENFWLLNYYSQIEPQRKLYSRTLFPFFHSWNAATSNGTIVFPIYLNADFQDEIEKDKFNNVNVNILGLTSQSSKGIFTPNVELDGGKISKYYYFDTDISWLYYAFRISSRTSTKLIEDLLPQKTPKEFLAKNENTLRKPTLESKRSFTREDSFNFFGMNLFFGVFGYEAADSKRHIRLLPLAWFTYDKEIEENIYAGPLPLPFVWYSSVDIKYRIIFPLYGYQQSEDAERQSYGLFLFLKENIRENNREETSVLWPFINWHDSDIKSGSRFLPFYWQRTLKEKGELSKSIFFPLLLSYLNSKKANSGETIETWLTPFLFRFDKPLNNGKQIRMFPTIPLFYWTYTNTKFDEETLFLSPFFIRWKIEDKLDKAKATSNFWLVPVIGFESESKENYWLNYFLLFNKYRSQNSDSLTIFPFYHRKDDIENGELIQRSSFYFPLMPILKTEKPIGKSNPIASETFISPLFLENSQSSEKGELYRERFLPIPFLYSERDKKLESNFSSLLLIFQYQTNKEKSSFRFLPIFQFSYLNEKPKKESDTLNWLFPLYWNSTHRYLGKPKSWQYSKNLITPLYTNLVNNEREIRFIPFLYFASENENESFRNYLLILSSTLKEDFESTSVLPFFHHSATKKQFQDEETSLLFPFYFFHRKSILTENNIQDKILIIPPLFYFSNEKYGNKYQNWFFFVGKEDTTKSSSFIVFPFYYEYISKPNVSKTMDFKKYIFPFYLSETETKEDGQLTKSSLWLPIFLFSKKDEGVKNEWSWLLFINSKSAQTDKSFDLYPIFHFDTSKSIDIEQTKHWLFPFYYTSSSQYHIASVEAINLSSSNGKIKNPPEKTSNTFNVNSFQFTSLLLNYSKKYSKAENDMVSQYFFPIVPIVYREESSKSSHTNILLFFDRKVNNNILERFIIFPYYYSHSDTRNEKSSSYYHLFPVYFSKVSSKEYTAFISGFYIDSNESLDYMNLLYLLEQKSENKNKTSEYSLLFRSFFYLTAPQAFNLRILYGIGEVSLKPKLTQMNFVWLSYRHAEEEKVVNLLPLYYNNESKVESESTSWVTPILYYSNQTTKRKLEHSTLGLVYFHSEDSTTQESLQNILLGIIYYKTVKPKERGYTGRGSLWGALWEYNTEEDTNYSKFSILKILYSRREDNEGVRHRILFFEF